VRYLSLSGNVVPVCAPDLLTEPLLRPQPDPAVSLNASGYPGPRGVALG